MIMSLLLFETEFLNIVSISFTALVLNELIMVAVEITTWYVRRFSLRCYQIFYNNLSLTLHLLGTYTWFFLKSSQSSSTLSASYSCLNISVSLFTIKKRESLILTVTFVSLDLAFVTSTRFAWKVGLIVAVSAFPLYLYKIIRSRIRPSTSSKLL